MSKTCTMCGTEYLSPSKHFHRDKSHKDGFHSVCKKCRKASYTAYNRTQKAKDLKRSNNLQRDFGMTLREYDKMLEKQGGVCAACGKPETARYSDGTTVKRLSVDHNHQTGKVRGLLCGRCNCALGYARDDKSLLLQLAMYVEGNE